MGTVLGFAGFYLWQNYQLEINRPASAKAGVLTPKYIPAVDALGLQENSFANYKIRFASQDLDTQNKLANLLQNQVFTGLIQDKSSEINLVLVPRLELSQLVSQPANQLGSNYPIRYDNINNIIVSGNYIYLPKESQVLFAKPQVLADSLFAASLLVKLYEQIPDSEIDNLAKQKQLYNLDVTSLVADFQANVLVGQNFDSWSAQNQELANSLAGLNDLCSNLKANYQLLICLATSLQINPNAALADNYKTFINTKLPLTSAGLYQSLGILTAEYLPKLTSQLDLKETGFNFKSWDLPALADKSYTIISISKYYQNVTATKLEQIKQAIVLDGWQFIKATDRVSNKQLSVQQYNWEFARSNSLQGQSLIIQIMDTTTINGDCIVATPGQEYCDGQSLYKNSDNYLYFTLASKSL